MIAKQKTAASQRKPKRTDAVNVKRKFLKMAFPQVLACFNREFSKIRKEFPDSLAKEEKMARVPGKNARLLEFSGNASIMALRACDAECDAAQVGELFKILFKAASKIDFRHINSGPKTITYAVSGGAMKAGLFAGLKPNEMLVNESEQAISDIVKQGISAAIKLSGRGAGDALATIMGGLMVIHKKIRSLEFKHSIACDIEAAYNASMQLLMSHATRKSRGAPEGEKHEPNQFHFGSGSLARPEDLIPKPREC